VPVAGQHSSTGTVSIYIMPTSPDVVRLLNDIRDEMVALFGISEAEAVARINRKWRGHELSCDADRSSWAPTAPPPPDSPCWA
jgi:hypothetical protein